MNPVFVILVGIGCLILFIILMPLFAKIGDKIIKRWNDTHLIMKPKIMKRRILKNE